MTRAEIKERAKVALGNKIFGANWGMAVLAVFLQAIIVYAVGAVPGVGGILSVLLYGPISVGVAGIFLNQSRTLQQIDVGNMFGGFSKDFGGNLLLGLMIRLFTVLWSLLFIIPGIVKMYAYSMAFYIKNDHPDYDWKKCMDESQIMMNGHKSELFVLDLSFIGWYIVGSFCLGIGVLWVNAYMEATHAEFYNSLKQN